MASQAAEERQGFWHRVTGKTGGTISKQSSTHSGIGVRDEGTDAWSDGDDDLMMQYNMPKTTKSTSQSTLQSASHSSSSLQAPHIAPISPSTSTQLTPASTIQQTDARSSAQDKAKGGTLAQVPVVHSLPQARASSSSAEDQPTNSTARSHDAILQEERDGDAQPKQRAPSPNKLVTRVPVPPELRDRQAMRLAKFERVVHVGNVDLEQLRTISWSGVPEQQRATVWQLLAVRVDYFVSCLQRTVCTVSRVATMSCSSSLLFGRMCVRL
eukprot:m.117039 g.117039  ORF g.117039 m.117039 type:complete len:269 (-) comp13623_c0_seq5:1111-1917(-)